MSNVCSSAAGALPSEITLITPTGVVSGAVISSEPGAATGFSSITAEATGMAFCQIDDGPGHPDAQARAGMSEGRDLRGARTWHRQRLMAR